MSLCNEVQELVSAAYDGEVTDTEAITAARAHCARCAECAAFVTFLGAVRRIESPAVPEATIARALDAVRAEVAAEATAREPAAASEAAASAEADTLTDTVLNATPMPGDILITRRLGGPAAGATPSVTPDAAARPGWLAWRPWTAAAAVLFIGAVLIGSQGVRYILSPPVTVEPLAESSFESAESDDSTIQLRSADESVPGDDAAADIASPMTSEPQTTDFVAFDGFAYRLTGEAPAPETPSTATVTSALDSSTVPQRLEAWPGPSPRTLTVAAGPERHLLFERVERMLGGRAFALAADRIDSFAAAVALPSGIPRPASPDGSPTFVSGGTDDTGTEVFIRPGADPLAGFALAPGDVSSEWTWWAPAD